MSQLATFIGKYALMLRERSLQFLVSGLAGGGESEFVASIGLVVATAPPSGSFM